MSHITKGMIPPLALAAAVLLIAAVVWLIFKLPKIKVALPLRMLITVLSVAMISGFVSMVAHQSSLAASMKYQNIFGTRR